MFFQNLHSFTCFKTLLKVRYLKRLNSIKKNLRVFLCFFFVFVGNLSLVTFASNKKLEQQVPRYVDLSGAVVRISPVGRSVGRGWPDTLFIPDRRSNTRFLHGASEECRAVTGDTVNFSPRTPSIFTGFDWEIPSATCHTGPLKKPLSLASSADSYPYLNNFFSYF